MKFMTIDGKSDQKTQRVKKSETLEVRIPHETKQAFLTACREDGTTASEVVRAQVQTYLDVRERDAGYEGEDDAAELARLDGDFVLMSMELDKLVEDLLEIFGSSD
jgi:hypothetical protein